MTDRPLLRYGETLTGFFGQGPPDYHKNCQDLLEGEETVWKWLQILLEAQRLGGGAWRMGAGRHWISSFSTSARTHTLVFTDIDLLKLSRRATTRFPLTRESAPLWWKSADVQWQAGRTEAARHTASTVLQLVPRADWYVEWSQWEGGSTEILKKGLRLGAEPKSLLEEALRKVSMQVPRFPMRREESERKTAPPAEVVKPSLASIELKIPERKKDEAPMSILKEPRHASVEARTAPSSASQESVRFQLAPSRDKENKVLFPKTPSQDEKRADETDTTLQRRRRPPLLTKTPRRSQLLGKAQRVDPTALPDEEDDDTMPPKKVKMDLSYMWEWNPEKRNETHSSGETAASITQSPKKRRRLEESMEPSEAKSTEKKLKTKSTELPVETTHGRLNPDFLRLASEDNMLRVNGTAYAKLGVIGKGGSCKVYRALSKDSQVVAIKKVKVQGLDQKAIDGYSNEIALLKRLRGNPSIIQMFDSQVSSQAIFLVMELGEVDLNQVLQQQKRHLNLNFVRLTWQQMLGAVHSIHEERIIHGDLKPANFLFVRGALKLIDFGIAKAIQSDDTTNIYRESQIGTLNYMSPEAIMDTGTAEDGTRIKIGRVSNS